MAQTQEHLGTGRRKTAVARVRIAPGAGKVTVNGRALENYFLTESQRLLAMQALAVTESASKYNIRVNVSGGGPNGQAGAVRHTIQDFGSRPCKASFGGGEKGCHGSAMEGSHATVGETASTGESRFRAG